MVQAIYKGCSACTGEGVIKAYSNPNTSTSKTGYNTITCEACEGLGRIPTGDFIMIHSHFPDKRPIMDQVKDLFPMEQRAILAKFT